MKVEKLTINNFKNYDGEVLFDLSKQITILHGDNGFGKSSFFDAIEWCLTNKIDRFNGTEGDIKKDIINRNCNLDSFKVSVCIEFGGNQITRSFNVTNGEIGNTQVKLREKSGVHYRGQENIEEFLKSEYFKDINFARGAYGQLFKQTYILSQDQVTDFVTSEDAEERYRALANIMGLKSMLNESDNAKKILSALKATNRTFEDELKQYDESIKSKKEAKHVIDVYDLNSKLNQIGINNSQDDIEFRCKELQSEMINTKSKNENFIKLYKKLQLDKFESINNINDQITNKENRQKELQIKVKESNALLLKIEDHIEGLKKEKQHINKYNQIRSQIREHEINLHKLEITENNFDEINGNLNLFRNRASKLEYQISIRQTLSLNLDKIEEMSNQNKLFENKKSLILKRKTRFQRLIKRLAHSIDNNKNKLLVNLISNIKDIQEYVKNNNLHKCPVCSSVPEQKLEKCIEHNVVFFNKKIEEDTKYVEKSLNLKKKLENKIQFFDEEINRIVTKEKNNTLLIQRLSEELINYKTNKLYDKELENYSEEDLKIDLLNTREKINTQQKGAESLLILKGLYENLKDVEKQGMKKKQTDLKERLVANINNSLDRFYKAEKRIKNYISKNKKFVNGIKSEIQELDLVVMRIKDFISINQFDQNLSEIFSKALDNVKNSENKISILSNVTEMLVALKMNGDIEKQINSIKEKRSNLFMKKVELNKVIDALSNHINQKSNEFGNEVKDFLNRDNSPIQRYFRYLNPLPSNSQLRFEGEDEKLNIKVVFADNSRDKLVSNAKNVLSSGQLNVLAISIFLAINEGQKTHSLDFVAIDDPIQNMDDVNQYSICDILGYIKKQLIISTHDIEFLKLFIKKNEHRKEEIQVYSFISPYLNKEKVQHIQFT
ncbi:AAA family ATPase [Rossellomorea sp. BNER]|uniref:AAA family ATPase n=1 Tax=Rossellomorea sp. BNER TaxID=2962031 RepID=UPI003AF1FC04|nr:SMC family ATPase [Rossellomorea sp. BNER]